MNEKIGFTHIRWGNGIVTAAFERLPREQKSGKVNMAFSFCAPGDHWDRKKGNKIAVGRLTCGKSMVCDLDMENSTTPEQVAALLLGLMIENQTPRWMSDTDALPRDRRGQALGTH